MVVAVVDALDGTIRENLLAVTSVSELVVAVGSSPFLLLAVDATTGADVTVAEDRLSKDLLVPYEEVGAAIVAVDLAPTALLGA